MTRKSFPVTRLRPFTSSGKRQEKVPSYNIRNRKPRLRSLLPAHFRHTFWSISMTFSEALQPYRKHLGGATGRNSHSGKFAPIFSAPFAGMHPRERFKTHGVSETQRTKWAGGGVTTWAGTTPVLGGLARPNPPSLVALASRVVPAHVAP